MDALFPTIRLEMNTCRRWSMGRGLRGIGASLRCGTWGREVYTGNRFGCDLEVQLNPRRSSQRNTSAGSLSLSPGSPPAAERESNP